MPTTFQQRALGWGSPGQPGSAREQQWKQRNLRLLRTLPRVKTLWVHKAAREEFAALLLYLSHTGARLGQTVDDWGFANRRIRGFLDWWSYHRWAIAIDLDATEHPLGKRHTTFAANQAEIAQVRAVCKRLGLRWGFDYAGRPDPMHFEFTGSRLRARWIASRLRRDTKRSRALAKFCGLSPEEFRRKMRQA